MTHAQRTATYVRANAEGTRRLAAAAAAAGVRADVVYVSTRAINPSGGGYSRSKCWAEQAVRESSLSHVIVRLPELYGTGGTEGVDRIIDLARRNAPIPLVAGDAEVAPLPVGDAIAACVGAVAGADCVGRTFTIAGESVSLARFVELAVVAFCSSSRVVTVPVALMRVMAAIAYLAPLPLYPDQLARLRAAKPGGTSDAPEALGFTPTPLLDGLRALAARERASPSSEA